MNILLPIVFLAIQVPPAATFEQALLGSWVGTLEYRDYSDNSRERLGTLLRIYRPKNSENLSFRYVYDDGPTKVVQDTDQIAIDLPQRKYSIFSTDGKLDSEYVIAPASKLNLKGYGTITLTGKATENNVPVDIRETLTIQPTRLRILRESRIMGQEFKFRHEFQFSRVDLPTSH